MGPTILIFTKFIIITENKNNIAIAPTYIINNIIAIICILFNIIKIIEFIKVKINQNIECTVLSDIKEKIDVKKIKNVISIIKNSILYIKDIIVKVINIETMLIGK